MKDISDLEYMINSLYKKWKYHLKFSERPALYPQGQRREG